MKMTYNNLANLEINEVNLEFDLFNNTKESEGDAVSLYFKGQKYAAKMTNKSHGTIPGINPFLKQGFYIDGGRITLFPKFEPSNEFQVRIKGYKPVFEGRCSLVLCELHGKDILFFDPETDPQDYESKISTEQRIKLAAVSVGGSYTVSKEELKGIYTPEALECLNKRGFLKAARIPLYNSVFDVVGNLRTREPYLVLNVKNPVNQAQALELITNSANFETEKGLSKIVADFYFIGFPA